VVWQKHGDERQNPRAAEDQRDPGEAAPHPRRRQKGHLVFLAVLVGLGA
jgi:hypothetical protein